MAVIYDFESYRSHRACLATAEEYKHLRKNTQNWHQANTDLKSHLNMCATTFQGICHHLEEIVAEQDAREEQLKKVRDILENGSLEEMIACRDALRKGNTV